MQKSKNKTDQYWYYKPIKIDMQKHPIDDQFRYFIFLCIH